MLHVRTKVFQAYGANEFALATRIGAQLSGILMAANQRDRAVEIAKIQGHLAELTRIASSDPDPASVFSEIAEIFHELVEFDRLTLFRFGKTDTTCEVLYTTGTEISGWKTGVIKSLTDTPFLTIISTNETIVIGDINSGGLIHQYPRLSDSASVGLLSFVAVPLVSQGEIVGAISVGSKTKNAYGSPEVELAELIARQIGGVIANSELRKELYKESEESAVIAEIGRVVNSDLDLDRMFNAVADQLSRLIEFDRIYVSLFDTDDEQSNAVTVFWRGQEVEGQNIGDLDSDILHPATVASRIVPDFTTETDEPSAREVWLPALIAAPLARETGRPIGLIGLRHSSANQFTQADLKILERIAVQLTPAVVNSRLLGQIAELSAGEERTRIARDLHDSVSQDLFALMVRVDQLEKDVTSGDSPHSKDLDFGPVRKAAAAAMIDTRQAIWNLTPSLSEGLSLGDTLRQELIRVTTTARMKNGFEISGVEIPVSDDISINLVRIAQEALSNIVRHAEASRIDLRLSFSGNSIHMDIVDDGAGFSDPNHLSSGFGLSTMRNRAESMGGQMSIETSSNGSIVKISVAADTSI